MPLTSHADMSARPSMSAFLLKRLGFVGLRALVCLDSLRSLCFLFLEDHQRIGQGKGGSQALNSRKLETLQTSGHASRHPEAVPALSHASASLSRRKKPGEPFRVQGLGRQCSLGEAVDVEIGSGAFSMHPFARSLNHSTGTGFTRSHRRLWLQCLGPNGLIGQGKPTEHCFYDAQTDLCGQAAPPLYAEEKGRSKELACSSPLAQVPKRLLTQDQSTRCESPDLPSHCFLAVTLRRNLIRKPWPYNPHTLGFILQNHRRLIPKPQTRNPKLLRTLILEDPRSPYSGS